MGKNKLPGILSAVLFFIMAALLMAQTEDAARIFDQKKEGVFFVVVYGANKDVVTKGAGFGIGEEMVLTSYHLVSRADSIEVINHKGKKSKAEGIISVDRNMDVAILKIKGKTETLLLGNSDELEAGNRIFGLGANESGDIIISEGTVRNIINLSPSQRVIDMSLSIPDTFCGAPLLNLDGQVMAITVVLEKGAKVGAPVNAWKALSRQGKATDFKNWKQENYWETFEGAYLAGRILALTGDSYAAQNYLEKVVRLNPSLIDAHALLASVYTEQRNYSSAIDSLKKVIELDAGRPDAHFSLGSIYMKTQRWNEAVSSFEKASSLDPSNKEAFFFMGSSYEEIRDFAKAADAYEKFLKLNPETAWTGYLRMGICRMELGQFDGAITALESALKENSQDVKLNYTLAQAYQRDGQFEKAAEVYERLSQINPDEATSYYGLIVKMYDEAGRFAEAIEAAKKVVELNPKSEMAVFNLGIMYFKLERFDEAIATFRKALEVKPDYELAWYNIGYSYSKQKKYKESIEAFNKFVELSPDSPDGWFNIGIGYMLLKDFESALEPIRKTVELRPDYGVALYNLAIVYLNLKDNYSAREIYKKLVNIDPELADKLKKLLR